MNVERDDDDRRGCRPEGLQYASLSHRPSPPGTRPRLGRRRRLGQSDLARIGPNPIDGRQVGRDRFGRLVRAGRRDPPAGVPPAGGFADSMAASRASSSRTRRVSSSNSTSPCPDGAPAVLGPTEGSLSEVGSLAEVSRVSVPLVGEAAAVASAVGSSPDGNPPGEVIDPGGAPAATQKRDHCCKTSLDCPSRAMALSWSCHRSMKRRAKPAGSFR